MKDKNTTVHIQGIKCDYCDWRDNKILYEDYPMYVNKPCPKCGHNLLTKQDYRFCKVVVFLSKLINLFPSKKTEKQSTLKIDCDGRGHYEFFIKEDNNGLL